MTGWLVYGLAAGLAFGGAACGSDSGTTATTDAAGFGDAAVASCTIVQFFDGGAATLCFETLADVGPSFEQTCDQNAAMVPPDAGTETFKNDGGCSRVNALGACQSDLDGLVENQWYYTSGGDAVTSVFNQAASDIKSLCGDMGDIYLLP